MAKERLRPSEVAKFTNEKLLKTLVESARASKDAAAEGADQERVIETSLLELEVLARLGNIVPSLSEAKNKKLVIVQDGMPPEEKFFPLRPSQTAVGESFHGYFRNKLVEKTVTNLVQFFIEYRNNRWVRFSHRDLTEYTLTCTDFDERLVFFGICGSRLEDNGEVVPDPGFLVQLPDNRFVVTEHFIARCAKRPA